MSGVYVVVAMAHSKLEVLETYAGVQSALGRAWNLAYSRHDTSIEAVNADPSEEKMPDGSIRWVILQNPHAFVGVYYKTIQTSLKSRKELEALDASTCAWVPPTLPSRGFDSDPPATMLGTQTQPKDNKHDANLPAGWSCQNKPISMQSLYDDSSNVMAHSYLDKSRQWALTKARIAKRPHYTIVLSDGLYTQSTALQCLGKNHNDANIFGWEIVADEMEFLASLTYGLINH